MWKRRSLVLAAAVLLVTAPAVWAAGRPGWKATSVVRADKGSGRLIRRVEPVKPPGKVGGSFREAAEVDKMVRRAADKHGVDPLLVHSVIEVESNYNPFAVSPKGAEGLMQLTASTARRFGVRNSFVPSDNIETGVRYLKYLQDLFQDDRLALAAYNAGEGAVARHNQVPPYRETREYVERVRARYKELRQASRGAGAEVPEQAEGTGYQPVEAFLDSDGRLHLRNAGTR